MTALPRVTIWNEGRHEQHDAAVQAIYPHGIHEALAAPLRAAGFSVQTALLDQPEHGLTTEVLDQTDVLIWWGHMAHEDVQDAIVERVAQRVLDGMGLVALHSAHHSKIFRRMMGTGCMVKWREIGERQRVWVVEPSHPIADGLGEYFEVQPEEMYGEFFDIPTPDELVFISWFQGGEVFRSGCCYRRGRGRVFYFQPGHETYPTYHQPVIQQVIRNAVRWAAPGNGPRIQFGHRPDPLETVKID